MGKGSLDSYKPAIQPQAGSKEILPCPGQAKETQARREASDNLASVNFGCECTEAGSDAQTRDAKMSETPLAGAN